jgi:dienelactone hydrolase
MNRHVTRCLLAALVASPASAITLALPVDASVARPVVTVGDAAPGAAVELSTQRRSRDGKTVYEGRASLTADAAGQVVVDSPDELAVFWNAGPRVATPADPPSGVVQVTVRAGTDTASAVMPVRPLQARVVKGDDAPFPGAVWVRSAAGGRLPVIIVLGGSEGGDTTARDYAPLLAAQGYAVLGLPYYNGFGGKITGLPDAFADIDVARLQAVRLWLQEQPDVDASRIGIWGVSKGAEFALIAASRYSWVKAVAAIVPSDVVWEGWGLPGQRPSSFAFAGTPLPYVPYDRVEEEFAKYGTGGRPDLRRAHDDGRRLNPDRVAAARIRVEDFAGPVLVAGGDRDSIWASGPMAQAVAATRRRAGRPVVLVHEADAGHALAGPGLEPAQPYEAAGGKAAAIARARLAAWAATLDLFASALKDQKPAR